jgi:hypothetical protein
VLCSHDFPEVAQGGEFHTRMLEREARRALWKHGVHATTLSESVAC